LHTPHAKLLWIIASLFNASEISLQEKKSLKERVISDDEAILELIDHFSKNKDYVELRGAVVSMAKGQVEEPQSQASTLLSVKGRKQANMDISIPKRDPSAVDDISSPLGNYLIEMKRKGLREAGAKKIQSLNSTTPSKTDQTLKKNIRECDEGPSPKVESSKLMRNGDFTTEVRNSPMKRLHQ